MINFSHKNSLINKSKLNSTLKKLDPELNRLNKALKTEYEDDRASINLPIDKSMLKNIKANINKFKNADYLIVAGIGGSNLGTIAIQEAVLGQLYNQFNPKTKVLYADTVDPDLISSIICIVEPELKKGKKVILNGVSKSGGTTETIANFEILANVIKKYHKDYEKYIVVTTDKDSKFYNLAKQKNFTTLEIPKKVGGRFSVFSPVGLFPLGLLGINLDKLLKGAQKARKEQIKKDSPATISAAIKFLHKTKHPINDLFIFSKDLESVGKWYRQLMGESIAKEKNLQNKKVFTGLTPTVSIGSTDLHSMAQLYLGGPYDKYTTFISTKNNRGKESVPNIKAYNKLVPNIQNKFLKDIMSAILKGTQTAYKKGKRPYSEIILKNKSEESIGELLQFFMIEMMFLGHLMNVNTFDQPNVENYKIETKKLLK